MSFRVSCIGVEPFLSYNEFQEINSQKQSLNKESGWIPGVSINHLWTTDAGNIESAFAFSGGNVDYHGQTQLGTPHQTVTRHRHLDIGARFFPKVFTIYRDNGWQANLFASIHYRYWYRDIQAAQGVTRLTEDYSWQILGLGISVNRARHDVALWFGRNINAQVRVRETSCFDDFMLYPKQDNAYNIEYAFETTERSYFIMKYQSSRLSRSADKSVNTCAGLLRFHEPASEMKQLVLGIGWLF
ncbi:hypothetical protein [Bermanella sp. R86510]|uniref:hypothetical protein n=1 Tax=unclassified Bermanella TaxID=2627862 RepID=UPI0037CB053F